MSRDVNASELVDLWRRQRDRALALHGRDELASVIEPARTVPLASAAYALACLEFWHASVLKPAVEKSLEGYNTDADCIGSIASPWHYGGRLAWNAQPPKLSYALADRIGAEEGCGDPLAARMVRATLTAYHAILMGSPVSAFFGNRKAADGTVVMDPVSAKRFWDATRTIAGDAQAAAFGAVTDAERWAAFKEGAEEGGKAASRAAGEFAGNVLRVAGEAAAEGVKGLVDGLGLMNVALIAGGAYVAFKVV